MNIAFLAHDKKKELMVQFCTAYKNVLMKHNLFATATTGRLIADNTNLPITLADARTVTQKSALRADRDGDNHYDLLSALQKSIRGSDPDAACHYLARLLEAGSPHQ